MMRLCYLYKIVSTKQTTYLYDLIPPFQRSSWSEGVFISHSAEMGLKNSFLAYAIKEWNKLDPGLVNFFLNHY